MKKINLKINGRAVSCDQNKTIMQAAHDNGIELPNLCWHPDFSVKANCRICAVEITGRKGLAAACSTPDLSSIALATEDHFLATGKPAPPRPTNPACLILNSISI